MIISIRGTSGSGKTHLARAVMDRLGPRQEIPQEGERQHVGYVCFGPPLLRVLGRYNVASGGADRISNRELAFRLLGEWAPSGHVLYEGLLIGNEVQRTILLNRTNPTHVIFLDVPLDACLEAINARRASRGETEPVSLKKTTEKFEELKRVRFRLKDAGVKTYYLGREAALDQVLNLLEMKR